MRTPDLNLSQRPFRNARPVTRLAIALAVLGCLLLSANLAQYWRFFSGSDERRTELAEAQLRVANKEKEVARLKASIGSFDLAQQNDQVDFLNRKIAERTFSWSRLFDRLSEVLPADVRLNTLSPKTEGLGSEFGEPEELEPGELPGDRVDLGIIGEAKSVEAELEFIDRLFEHPSFQRPRLNSDSNQQGLLRFQISVVYFPDKIATPEQMVVASSGEEDDLSPGTGKTSPNQPTQAQTELRRSPTPLGSGRSGPSEPAESTASKLRALRESARDEGGSDGAVPRGLDEALAANDRSSESDSRSRSGSTRRESRTSNRRQLTNPRGGGVPQQGLTVGVFTGGASAGAANPGDQADSNPLTRGTDRRRPSRPPEPPRGPDRSEPAGQDREDDTSTERPTPRRPSASAPLEIQ